MNYMDGWVPTLLAFTTGLGVPLATGAFSKAFVRARSRAAVLKGETVPATLRVQVTYAGGHPEESFVVEVPAEATDEAVEVNEALESIRRYRETAVA